MSPMLQSRTGPSPRLLLARLLLVVQLAILELLLVLTLVLTLRDPAPGTALAWVVQAFGAVLLLLALPRLWRWATDDRSRSRTRTDHDPRPSQHSTFAGPDAPAPPRRW